jgi:hypothetical protein
MIISGASSKPTLLGSPPPTQATTQPLTQASTQAISVDNSLNPTVRQLLLDQAGEISEMAKENQRLADENIQLKQSLHQLQNAIEYSKKNPKSAPAPDWPSYKFNGSDVYVVPLD